MTSIVRWSKLYLVLCLAGLWVWGGFASRAQAAGVITVTTTADSGDGSLRQAITAASSGDTIQFDPSLSGQTIVLSGSELQIGKALTIEAGLGSGPVVSGGGARRVFSVLGGYSVTMRNFTIRSGAVDYGGGLWVKTGATVALEQMTFSANTATDGGGAIYNAGTLTISASTLDGNSTGFQGGAIYNSGSVTIQNSTFSANISDVRGGGIYNSGSLTLQTSTLSANTSGVEGGDSSNAGGGLYNQSNASLANTTFSGNLAVGYGGGVYTAGTLTLLNATFAGNTASSGGGLYQVSGKTTSIINTLIAASSGGDCVSAGALSPNQNNFIQDGTCSPAGSGSPKISSLADHGGATTTIALLVGSPAIDAGSSGSCPPLDQRGVARPVNGGIALACDIGAYEYEPAPLAQVWGAGNLIANHQAAVYTSDGTNFGAAEIGRVAVTRTFSILNAGDLNLSLTGSPRVMISADAAGVFLVSAQPASASILPNGSLSFDVAFQPASLGTFTAQVEIASNDPNQAVYQFAIQGTASCFDTITATSSANSGAGTLRQALLDICPNGKIHLGSDLAAQTITLSGGPLSITRSVLIDADAALGLQVSGGGAQRVFEVRSPAVAQLRGFAIADGFLSGGVSCPLYCGAGVYVYTGAGLELDRMLIVHNQVSGNGGGILAAGTLTLTNTTFSNNTAQTGGAIYASGALIMTNDTLVGNSATSGTGGLHAFSGSTLTLRNSLLAGNVGGDCRMQGSSWAAGSSNQKNLIRDGSCSPALTADPKLAPLGAYGGAFHSFALLPGSPAIDGGAASVCPATDARGTSRPQVSGCDIGAFESAGFSVSIQAGDNQSVEVDAAYQKLVIKLTAADSLEPFWPGGSVTYTAPESGASLALKEQTAALSASGAAEVSVSANGAAGVFAVTVSTAGLLAPVDFTLTNLDIAVGEPLLSAPASALIGEDAAFSASVPAGTNVIYSWTFGDGGSAEGIQVSHAYAARGQYQVTLTAANSASTKLVKQTIDVLDVSIQGLGLASSSPCQLGQSMSFTPSVTAGTNVVYTIEYGDQSSADTLPFEHLFSAPGTYSVKLTATNKQSAQTKTIQVQVNDIPIQSLKVQAAALITSGTKATFQALVEAGSNVIYTWDFGDGGQGSGSQVEHAFSAVGTYHIRASAANLGSQTSTLVDLEVIDIALSGLQVSVGAVQLGSPSLFQGSLTSGTNPTYSWDFGDGSSGVGADPSHTYSAIGSYTYEVTVANSLGSLVFSGQALVEDVPINNLNIAPPPAAPRTGLPVLFEVVQTAGSNVTCLWDFGDGKGADTCTASHIYAQPGFYQVKLSAQNSVSSSEQTMLIEVNLIKIWLAGIFR